MVNKSMYDLTEFIGKALLFPSKIYAHFFDVHGVTVKSCSKSKHIKRHTTVFKQIIFTNDRRVFNSLTRWV